jgi:hypothetical protein
MFEKEDFELPNPEAGADIPNLKKKDEERKKSGFAWGSKPVGSPFAGATAEQGAVVGARAAASVARVAASAAQAAGAEAAAGAAVETGILSQIGAFFSAMTSSLLGRAALMAAAALIMGSLAAVSYRMLNRPLVNPGPDLGSIASTVKVSRQTGASGLSYAPKSAQPQLAAPAPSPEAKSDGAKLQDPVAAPGQPVEAVNGELPQGITDAMAHNLSGSKLSAGLGGQFGGAAGSAGPLKIGGQNGTLGQFAQQNSASSRGGALSASKGIRGSASLLTSGKHMGLSSKNMALLRGMASKYNTAMRAGTGTESNAQAASSQYEATELVGATPITGVADKTTVNPVSGGPGLIPPDAVNNCDTDAGMYVDSSGNCVPTPPAGTNATPWQSLADASKGLILTSLALLLTAACAAWVPWLKPFAHGLAIAAGIMALTVIGLGAQINSLGGAPLGTQEMIAGGLLAATAARVVWVPPSAYTTHAAIYEMLIALMGALTGLL